MYDVKNKTVMITGGAGGLGREYAEILLRNGARSVAVVDLAASKGQDVVAGLETEFGKGRAVFLACDLTKANELEATFGKVVDAFGGLDVLINNAGILDEHHWERTIDLNVKALIRASMLAFNHMGRHLGGKGGVIVNVSSVAGLHPTVFLPMYAASKYAVRGFSQSLAGLHDASGVRVVVMCPGATKTSIVADLPEKIYDSVKIALDERVSKMLKDLPMQTTDNVASAMLALIQKGKNGAVWVSENDEPPYTVNFTHYSKRALPV